MQSNRDHGTSGEPGRKSRGKVPLPSAGEASVRQVAIHPALKALVQLMAREAASDLLAALDASTHPLENADDQIL
jgi:hypothetical protein